MLLNGQSKTYTVTADSGAKNILGRTGDAEQKLLRQIKKDFCQCELIGSHLEIETQPSFISKGGRVIPIGGANPCEFCNAQMSFFAMDNKMTITYRNQKNIFTYP